MANKHWTERSIDDFLYHVVFDFVRQIEKIIEDGGIDRVELAKALNITEGQLSRMINNPEDLTLTKIIELSRVLGKKVSVVVYDDGDAENKDGPINAEIFAECWKHVGKPTDFFELAATHLTNLP